ncbi:MAG: hypothetical protein ACLGIN_13075 [Candidatus Sericytochromatia bacterium]
MKRAGISLVEVTIAMVVIAVVALGFVGFQGAMVKSSQKEKDRTFAMQKAIQMMEELKAKVAADAALILDDFNNGDTSYSFNLTTEGVPSPASTLSDNIPVPVGSYRYVRQIDVRPLPRDKGGRQVTIRVYLSNRKSTAGRAVQDGAPLPALATLTNIFKTPPVIVAPSQLFNVFTMRMDGIVPGKWTNSSYSNPGWFGGFENTAISYLKSANPGLEIVKRDIRLPAYGRDPWYSPLYNTSNTYNFQDGTGYGHNDTSRIPLNKVYYLLGNGGPPYSSWEVFQNGPFRKTLTAAGATSEGNGTYAPTNYADDPLAFPFTHANQRPIADQFNHALRYVEEKEKVEAGSELTLRYLLDQMLEKKRRNVILSNTHGEVFPMIPMRNYSDAARVPREMDSTRLRDHFGINGVSDSDDIRDGSEVRLVTHPLKLEHAQTDWVELRVFPYKTDDTTDEPDHAEYRRGKIVLREVLSNLDDIHTGLDIEDLEIRVVHKIHEEDKWRPGGGPGGTYEDLDAYGNTLIWPATATGYSSTLRAQYIQSVEKKTVAANGYKVGDLVISLKDIPYTHRQVQNDYTWGGGGNTYTKPYYGLHSDARLYNQYYLPDPLLPTLDIGFDHNSNDENEQPRNTARFFIKLKLEQPQRLEVLTTIGSEDDLTKHKRPNLSRTWTWVGLSVPESERYQLIGDPRHSPYRDVRNGFRYNRYFADFKTNAYRINSSASGYGAAWNMFDHTANGWGGSGHGKHEADVPAYFAIWRNALMGSNSMLAQPTGNAFRIVALGGEYGGETWTSVVRHSRRPFEGDTDRKEFDTWKEPTIVVDKDNDENKWFSMPWLGEIWPDNRWEDWRDTGNLPSSRYRHRKWEDVKGYEKQFTKYDHTRYVDQWGPTGFFYADTHFGYRDAWELMDKTPINGKALDADLNAKLNPDLNVRFGFLLNDTGLSSTPPDEHGMTRTSLSSGLVLDEPEYYKLSGGRTGLMPFVMRGASGGEVAYFNFFSPVTRYSGNNDPYSFMRIYFASVIQGFMDMAGPGYRGGGTKAAEARIKLPPRVKLLTPEDDALVTDSTVLITWEPQWTRWDTKPYSRHYADYTAGHTPEVVYNIKYSPDQGKTWRYVNGTGGTSVGPGARYYDARRITGTSFAWDLGSLPNRQYQIRIEAYRTVTGAEAGTYEQDHHAFTQFSINLAR